mmetsp:Transcript_9968/g.37624  ORF Transcript_9968/g.37624 Transcript_9968/m.37624 type:complete len:228 (+) Transcript_9968:742-1425(+)
MHRFWVVPVARVRPRRIVSRHLGVHEEIHLLLQVIVACQLERRREAKHVLVHLDGDGHLRKLHDLHDGDALVQGGLHLGLRVRAVRASAQQCVVVVLRQRPRGQGKALLHILRAYVFRQVDRVVQLVSLERGRRYLDLLLQDLHLLRRRANRPTLHLRTAAVELRGPSPGPLRRRPLPLLRCASFSSVADVLHPFALRLCIAGGDGARGSAQLRSQPGDPPAHPSCA